MALTASAEPWLAPASECAVANRPVKQGARQSLETRRIWFYSCCSNSRIVRNKCALRMVAVTARRVVVVDRVGKQDSDVDDGICNYAQVRRLDVCYITASYCSL